MKIKTISRSEEAHTRETKLDVFKVHKNADPKLHPFEKAREVGSMTSYTVPQQGTTLSWSMTAHSGWELDG